MRPSNRPSGRVVRALSVRYLWVWRGDDEPRGDDTLARGQFSLPPYTVICKAWPAHLYTKNIVAGVTEATTTVVQRNGGI